MSSLYFAIVDKERETDESVLTVLARVRTFCLGGAVAREMDTGGENRNIWRKL